jgi:long-chain acyl-CoA synthetase
MPGANKIGTVGKPLPGVTMTIADDGEILARGRHVFDGYWHDEEASAGAVDAGGFFHTGDMGDLDSDGYLRITGRKKEILVTAAGKNVAPGPLEDALRANPLISQAMVVGDDEPFVAALVTLDEEALGHWTSANGRSGATLDELRADPAILAEVQKAVDAANLTVSRPEQIKKFVVLDKDLTEESGYLTPTLKVKRNVVAKDFAGDIAAIYGSHA